MARLGKKDNEQIIKELLIENKILKKENTELKQKIEDNHNHFKEVAENYVNESWGSFLDLDYVDLVLSGIGVGKIIALEEEKRIAELEAQVKYWKSEYEKLFNED